MSIDRTLHIKSGISSQRNVLTRSERIAVMKEDGTFDEQTGSALGLPKTRIKHSKVGTKKKEEPTAEADAEANAEAPVADTPATAAGAKKPAKGASKKS